MKVPQRILGLLAVAAPVVAGCGAEATEPASTKTDQNIQSESHPATPDRSDADTSDEAAPSDEPTEALPEETRSPAEPNELPPEWGPLEGPPVAPGSLSPSPAGDPCYACGMG